MVQQSKHIPTDAGNPLSAAVPDTRVWAVLVIKPLLLLLLLTCCCGLLFLPRLYLAISLSAVVPDTGVWAVLVIKPLLSHMLLRVALFLPRLS